MEAVSDSPSREDYMNEIERMARSVGHEAGKDAEPIADLLVGLDSAEEADKDGLVQAFTEEHLREPPEEDDGYEEWGLKKPRQR
jgi:hypothetical protein